MWTEQSSGHPELWETTASHQVSHSTAERPDPETELRWESDRTEKENELEIKPEKDWEETVTTALNYQTNGGVRILKAGEREGRRGGIKEHFVFW